MMWRHEPPSVIRHCHDAELVYEVNATGPGNIPDLMQALVYLTVLHGSMSNYFQVNAWLFVGHPQFAACFCSISFVHAEDLLGAHFPTFMP